MIETNLAQKVNLQMYTTDLKCLQVKQMKMNWFVCVCKELE